jgi:alkylation response protein AidB-like acyl-CoA dehydrogenase
MMAAPMNYTDAQRAAVEWLRASTSAFDAVPLPGQGGTAARWRRLIGLAQSDLARARLGEGHLDARAIMIELGASCPQDGSTWGVWTAEPGRVVAERSPAGWRLLGEKGWCSGAGLLDHAIVSATAIDGPRLFVVEPAALEPVPGSWPSIGMEATASLTMRFSITVAEAAALGGPHAYVERAGFWHGGAGVAACWYGGALGVAERLRVGALEGNDPARRAAWGRVRAALESAGALLERSAHEIDAAPGAIDAARRRAMRLRLVVEAAARATLAETTIALGAGPLAHERDYARRVTDLELYLRQLRPEAAAADFGAQFADEPITW